MEKNELMTVLNAYGADSACIATRFMDDVDFYSYCLKSFLADRSCIRLGRAIANADVGSAFAEAHALKGAAGNLGLTPLYELLCVMVEQLRAGSMRDLAGEYEDYLLRTEHLSSLLQCAGSAATA